MDFLLSGNIAALLAFAVLVGFRHSLEADHVAAMATLVTDRSRNPILAGLAWGIGHSISVMIAGAAMILLDIRFSETGAAVAELAVALMLVILGIRLFIRLRRGATLHVHRHSHRGIEHVHPHLHQHREHPQHEHRPAEAGSHDSHTGKALAPAHTGAVKGSLFVGSLHGLAGSSALTLLILGTIQSEVAAIAYLMLFSIGSTAGMTLASWIFGRKLQQVFTGPRFGTRLAAASAAVSVGLGMMIAWEEAPRVFSALGG